MAVFETPSSRKRRSRETPSDPFGRPSFRPEALTGALRDQVPLDLGEQREERRHDLRLDVAKAGCAVVAAFAVALLDTGCAGNDAGSPTAPTAPAPVDRTLVSIEIVNAPPAGLTVGYTVRLEVHGTYSDGTKRIEVAEWTSSEPGVASVDAGGAVRGSRRRRLHHHGDGRRPARDGDGRGPIRGTRRDLLEAVRVQRLRVPHGNGLRGCRLGVSRPARTRAVAAADSLARLLPGRDEPGADPRGSDPGDDPPCGCHN